MANATLNPKEWSWLKQFLTAAKEPDGLTALETLNPSASGSTVTPPAPKAPPPAPGTGSGKETQGKDSPPPPKAPPPPKENTGSGSSGSSSGTQTDGAFQKALDAFRKTALAEHDALQKECSKLVSGLKKVDHPAAKEAANDLANLLENSDTNWAGASSKLIPLLKNQKPDSLQDAKARTAFAEQLMAEVEKIERRLEVKDMPRDLLDNCPFASASIYGKAKSAASQFKKAVSSIKQAAGA